MNNSATGAKVDLVELTVTFDPAKGPALQDVSLSVEPGEFVSIIGPSGSGKTTLLRAIAGLITDGVDGAVTINSNTVDGPAPDSAFVFQADCLLPWRNVIDNVGYGLEMMGVPRKSARVRSQDLLGRMGLEGTEHQHPGQLSGGMRQRVNLARALAVDPKLLLLDEPFAALDAQTRDVLQLELMNIWEATGKTVVFVTHQLDEAAFLSDRVVVLGSSPGHIKEIVTIEGLTRPRGLDEKHTGVFASQVDRLWRLIKSEVLREQLHGDLVMGSSEGN